MPQENARNEPKVFNLVLANVFQFARSGLGAPGATWGATKLSLRPFLQKARNARSQGVSGAVRATRQHSCPFFELKDTSRPRISFIQPRFTSSPPYQMQLASYL
jgi:hypothetical protein